MIHRYLLSNIRHIAMPFLVTALVCSGLSLKTVSICFASEDYSVTIGDGTSSFSLEHASVHMEDSQMTVTVTPEEYQELTSALAASANDTRDSNSQAYTAADPVSVNQKDGDYSIELVLSGGSGKASVVSPTILTVKDGKAYAELTWSSSNYDYMIVAGETYLNEAEEGAPSQFHIPVTKMDEEMSVIADTTAMGTPHEVNYTLTFYSESIGSTSQMPQEAAKRVVMMAIIIIVVGGLLNHYVNKKKRH